MQLVRFQRRDNGATNIGLLQGDTIRSIESSALPKDMRALLGTLPEGVPALRRAASSGPSYALSSVRLLAPIGDPDKVLCVGLNYKDHAEESKMPLPQYPVIFAKFSNAIVGPEDTIRLPPTSDEVDYEVELVIVIGRGGKSIKRENAMEHVAGYTVGNDVSARDWQLKKGGSQWTIGKAFDTFAPIGPSIRVNDGTFDPHNARLWTEVNGRRLQDSRTDQIVFRTEDLVVFLSSFIELKPGDIIFTGTPPGVGFARKPQIFLQDGDSVTVAIEGIGELRNVCAKDRGTKQDSVLITGGNGMIGTWAAKLLLEAGKHVTLFDVREDVALQEQILSPQQMRLARRVYGDISDFNTVLRVVQEAQCSSIIHLAALQVPTCQADPILGARVNVLGAINIFEAAKRCGKIPVIYASSGAVAGETAVYTKHPLPDDTHHKPMVHYGVYKQTNEGTARVFWKHHQVPSVGLRPMTVFGVGRERGMTSYPTRAVKAVIDGMASYNIPFSGSTGFSYVRDIAAMFVEAAGAVVKQPGAHVFNIRGQVVEIEEFVQTIIRVLPESKDRITITGDELPIDSDVDDSNLRKFLGAKFPDTSLQTAIQETVSMMQANKARGVWHRQDLEEVPPATAPKKSKL
jgi:2-keto-4-pentenoate hydratase/2-oxohepta-3-ene-1,7-dioic acid hydratase in catechol pathway/nucleoside-diphosphate-sugar epimerase